MPGSNTAREGSYLLDCPSEIISSILLSCSRADHLRLSRVNKQLNTVANRLLYSTVQFRWTAPDTFEALTNPPVTIFLRTILGNPQLAVLVRSLRLVGNGSFWHHWRAHESLPTRSWAGTGSTVDRAAALVAELPLSYTADWLRGLEVGTMDAIIAFLLTRLQNLRSFVTKANFTKEMSLQMAMLRSALCGRNQVGWPPRSGQLEQVSADFYRNYDVQCDTNTDTLLPFFYLPAIQALDLRLDHPARFAWPAAAAPDCTTLTSLTLRHVRESALKEILSCTKRLAKLDWQFFYSERNMTTLQIGDALLYPPIADLDVLVDALTPIRDTLKDLTIRAHAIQPVQLEYQTPIEVRGSLEGLVDFPKVERFEVPLPFLAGRLVPNNRFRVSERIPQNLRMLVFNDGLQEFADSMLDLDEWNYDEIASNLRDWLLYEDAGSSTPFMRQLELGLVSGAWEGGLYSKLKRLLGTERVPVRVTICGKEMEYG
ncbi:hypothetical protein PG985_015771 [Apiospora marii]|uniref:uncharacterized protein n=1 Tax=Apiospora marii TaxID=335849 RepID=UPI00312EB155